MATKIGDISRPKLIIFTDDLPKTRSGKIMRRLLRDVAEGASWATPPPWPTRTWSRRSATALRPGPATTADPQGQAQGLDPARGQPSA